MLKASHSAQPPLKQESAWLPPFENISVQLLNQQHRELSDILNKERRRYNLGQEVTKQRVAIKNSEREKFWLLEFPHHIVFNVQFKKVRHAKPCIVHTQKKNDK
jgi:hypothetical protein